MTKDCSAPESRLRYVRFNPKSLKVGHVLWTGRLGDEPFSVGRVVFDRYANKRWFYFSHGNALPSDLVNLRGFLRLSGPSGPVLVDSAAGTGQLQPSTVLDGSGTADEGGNTGVDVEASRNPVKKRYWWTDDD